MNVDPRQDIAERQVLEAGLGDVVAVKDVLIRECL